jgi:hypothetical protein
MSEKKEAEKAGPAAAPEIPYAENLFAAEVYADEASFFSLKGGNVSIVFTSGRFDNCTKPATLRRVVVGRLVIPAAGAQSLAVGLYDYLTQNGFDPSPPKSTAN